MFKLLIFCACSPRMLMICLCIIFIYLYNLEKHIPYTQVIYNISVVINCKCYEECIWLLTASPACNSRIDISPISRLKGLLKREMVSGHLPELSCSSLYIERVPAQFKNTRSLGEEHPVLMFCHSSVYLSKLGLLILISESNLALMFALPGPGTAPTLTPQPA